MPPLADLALIRLWGAKWPPAGFVIDNPEPSPSATGDWAEGWAASLYRLGRFGGSQAEAAAGC
jgi:hypothetical protein